MDKATVFVNHKFSRPHGDTVALTAKRALGLEQNGWGVTVGGSGLSVTGASSGNQSLTDDIPREKPLLLLSSLTSVSSA